MKLNLMADYILVRQDPEREYGGGIVVAATSGIVTSGVQLGRTGTVTDVGPEVDRDQLKPGDRICYGEFDYPKAPDGQILLQDKDVCGVLD